SLLAVLETQCARALERLLAGGLAQRRQRIVADARKRAGLQFAARAVAHVDQPERLRARQVAAHAGAYVLEFLVARFGDVLRHLAALSALVGLALGGDRQPASIGRQRGRGDLHVLAQEHRRGRTGGIGAAQFGFSLALGLAALALGAQGFDQAQLILAQQVGLGCRRRIVLGLGRGGVGGGAIGRAPAEPVVAAAPQQG